MLRYPMLTLKFFVFESFSKRSFVKVLFIFIIIVERKKERDEKRRGEERRRERNVPDMSQMLNYYF